MQLLPQNRFLQFHVLWLPGNQLAYQWASMICVTGTRVNSVLLHCAISFEAFGSDVIIFPIDLKISEGEETVWSTTSSFPNQSTETCSDAR